MYVQTHHPAQPDRRPQGIGPGAARAARCEAEHTPLEHRLLGAVETYKATCAAARVPTRSDDAWLVFLAALARESRPRAGRGFPGRAA
ncbi:MAG TPA: hypothetical protein VFX49_03390 [Chloroflexota bacterium]|nr:hypothetical protein [Chloroflexota bacterium]